MPTISCHTLGCKVNQYDTQAMLELFVAAGYTPVPFLSRADVCLINTCTVTGTGDKKSLQLARRVKREYPNTKLILCGCLAQSRGEQLLSETGADLVIGTQHRADVVKLFEKMLAVHLPLCCVEPWPDHAPFESLNISGQDSRTRAVLKIQEGCENHCTYCIIPSVRGPIRSRPLEDIRKETASLSKAGFQEIVLTGIHLSSYGRDLENHPTLLDAIRAVSEAKGILRVRLGSLEPTIATSEFAASLKSLHNICPQFHLALQSGSDTVLRRMKRRYNTEQFMKGIQNIRNEFPHAAFTTDILTGFPGETEEEYEETKQMIRKIGFSRIHVFPYSQREGTPAADMPDQLSDAQKEKRARELISLGKEETSRYLASWIGQKSVIIPEEKKDGHWEGYTPEYIRVSLSEDAEASCGTPVAVKLVAVNTSGMDAVILKS